MNALLSRLHKLDARLAVAEQWVVIAAVVLMLLASGGQVVVRFFAGGFPWADQLARFLVLWTSLLGAALATRRRKHITIDIVTKNLSLRGRAIVGLAGNALGVFVSAFLLVICSVYVHENFAAGTSATTFSLPIWIVQIVLPYGFLSMFFRFGIGLLEDAQGLRSGDFTYQHRFEDEADVHAAEEKAREIEKLSEKEVR